MIHEAIKGLLLPFLGTSLGAAGIYCVNGRTQTRLSSLLNDAAAGVMVAASIFSLLLPAFSQTDGCAAATLLVVLAFLAGVLLLALWDRASARLAAAGGVDHATRMLVLSVCLHNVPEGMAVGAAYAGLLAGQAGVTAMGAFALSLGIALQNLPEGAIISMPLHAQGQSKGKAFLLGMGSGAVEPVGALLTILAAGLLVPAMPYLLSFAAGAMLYVVVEELIPEMSSGEHSNIGVLMFSFGFTVMMALDVALG